MVFLNKTYDKVTTVSMSIDAHVYDNYVIKLPFMIRLYGTSYSYQLWYNYTVLF